MSDLVYGEHAHLRPMLVAHARQLIAEWSDKLDAAERANDAERAALLRADIAAIREHYGLESD
jgi:hypothetical protein